MSADPFPSGDDAFARGLQPMPAQDMPAGAPTPVQGYGQPQPMAPNPQSVIQEPIRGGDLPVWERRRRVKLQARKVRRIIRHIDPWSVMKVSLVFFLCLWVIFVLAAVLLWSVADSSGSIERVEDLVTSLLAWEDFTIEGESLFRRFALGGLILALAGTAFSVLLTVLFNLISDLVGGIRATVIEEESARFRPPRRIRR